MTGNLGVNQVIVPENLTSSTGNEQIDAAGKLLAEDRSDRSLVPEVEPTHKLSLFQPPKATDSQQITTEEDFACSLILEDPLEGSRLREDSTLKFSEEELEQRQNILSNNFSNFDLVADILLATEDALFLVYSFIQNNITNIPSTSGLKILASLSHDNFVTRIQSFVLEAPNIDRASGDIPSPANTWIGPHLVLAVLNRVNFAETDQAERVKIKELFADIISIVNESDLSRDASINLKSIIASALFRSLTQN
jgi:hypothetical protein